MIKKYNWVKDNRQVGCYNDSEPNNPIKFWTITVYKSFKLHRERLNNCSIAEMIRFQSFISLNFKESIQGYTL